jgi:hypothetical protein
MNILFIIIWAIFVLYSIFLVLLKIKIKTLELYIIKSFKIRNNLIPSIYEVTKLYFIRHEEIFKEILSFKKISFLENQIWNNIEEIIHTQKLIHNELDFIFKISNKHNKLNKNYKFNYVKDILIDKSDEIWNELKLYKLIVNKLNLLIKIKNITIIWLLIPITKIKTI